MKQLLKDAALKDAAFLVFFGFCVMSVIRLVFVMSGMTLAEYIWREPKFYLYVCHKQNSDDCELMEFVPDEQKI
jgi:hypothetical protein